MAKKIFAALALIIMGFFAVPLAANAAGYVPSGNIAVGGNTAPGGTVNVSFGSGSFQGGETVHFTVDGAGTVTLGTFKAAVVSGDKTAAADGSVGLNVTLPSDASGTYSITATGAESGTTATASFTVSTSGGSSNASGSGLADTGSTISILAIWIAAGLVLLGGAFVTVRVIVRRQNRTEA